MAPTGGLCRDDCGNLLSVHDIRRAVWDKISYTINQEQLNTAFRAINITAHILREQRDELLAMLESLVVNDYAENVTAEQWRAARELAERIRGGI